MTSLKFGTSGLRGLVVDLVGEPASRYTTAFVTAAMPLAGPGSPVLIGRDLRSSSAGIAATIAGAVAARGFRPLDCGTLPTPALALSAMRQGWPAIMVTGSHIPDDRNGLKFYTAQGEITKGDEAAVMAALAPIGCPSEPQNAESYPAALSLFRSRCIDAFPPDALAGLRIGIYQQSSVARDLLVEVVAALGGLPLPFGRAIDFVPVDTEAHRPEDIETLRAAAAAERLDAIVTTDGDGDRPLVADATGRVLPGDVIGTIAARHLGITAVVVPVTAGSAIESHGGFLRTLRTRVGSPFVIEGMERARREGCTSVAGFEANGGFLLGSDIERHGRRLTALPTRDALLPIIAILVAMRMAETTLATLAAGLGFKATAGHRLQDVAPDRSQALLERLRDAGRRSAFLAPLGAVAAVDDIDGVRITLDSGAVIHFRPSGNAPELRCYAEAESTGEAERIVAWGLAAAAAAMDQDRETPA